ncbi:hypothetical protein H2199_008957 [Coniosporium tulheliwenetii]|uniref:Uncharacterized protein n=1 Tax=Coniosporium tulheliwenetii TaxID=3383036 RepID=A0ACC2YGR8_9PEZI|nr:hypothetical protein H2199_008957 [Cladosporium sp. JES 115]
MTTESEWLNFTIHPPKRKRAELVCITCHSKKIKCDIQGRRGQGQSDCTNCSASGRECRIRPSTRDKKRRIARVEGDPKDGPSSVTHITNGVDALLAADDTFQALDTQNMVSEVIDPELDRTHQSPVAIRETRVVDFQPNPSPHRIEHIPAPVPQDNSPAQRSQASNGHTNTTGTQLGDVDTGFLQVYGLENQFDAENQAFAAQLEHRHSAELPPDLQQIFTDTYFEYCYPWCPVLDRQTLSDEIARSPLLANALALAASHIQPPLIPHKGPEVYYKKARTIFYDDEEADGVTSLKAISLFYWWAPQAPTRAHRHSSWWWTSVLIRHAQQMNFHREPGPDHPHRDRLDLSLRRRIWWTAFARERLTALCQSKPCIIDPDDCNIQEPSLADFPSDPQSQRKGEIFIYYQLQNMWASANVIAQGFDRLRQPTTALPTANPARPGSSATHLSPIASAHDHFSAIAQPPVSSRIDPGLTGNSPNILPDDCDFNWVRFFPFVSKSTNEIAENLVSGKEHGTATRGFPSPNNELFHDILLAQYQDLFDPFTGYTLNLLDITFNA